MTTIRNLSILLAFVLLGIMVYEGKHKDRSQAWINYRQPQMASYTSLEEDQKITLYDSYKKMGPEYFVKPDIFHTIQP